jgi:membrane protein required for colicin V production
MNILDITIILIIIITTVLGFWKGMQKQIFGLGGVVVGYIAAVKLYEPVAGLISSKESSLAQIASFILIFLLGKLVISLSGWFARNLFKGITLTWINRTGGALLGMLKGFIIIMIIILTLLAFLPADMSLIKNSVTLPYIASLPKITSGVIPEKIRTKYNDKVETLRSRWEKSKPAEK